MLVPSRRLLLHTLARQLPNLIVVALLWLRNRPRRIHSTAHRPLRAAVTARRGARASALAPRNGDALAAQTSVNPLEVFGKKIRDGL